MDNPSVRFLKLPKGDCPQSLVETNSSFSFEFDQNSRKNEEFTIVAMVLSAPANSRERMRVRKNLSNLKKMGSKGNVIFYFLLLLEIP